MTTFQDLVKIGLLGTAKGQLQTQDLPEAVQKRLASADTTDTEAHFLKAAVLELQYETAATLPAEATTPRLAPAPPETVLQPATSLQSGLLKEIIEDERYKKLLFFWIEKAAQNQVAVPHERLIFVIEAGKAATPEQRRNIQKVIGERGRWLAAHHKNWQWVTNLIPENDADFSVSELEAEWPKANVNERIKWAEQLVVHNPATAIDFAQEAYNQSLASKKGDASKTAKLKNLLAGYLLQQPTSPLCKATEAALGAYFLDKKTMLGLRSERRFELPESFDSFFSEENMLRTYGLVPASGVSQQQQVEEWAAFIILSLPPDIWEAKFGSDWHHIIGKLPPLFAMCAARSLTLNNHQAGMAAFATTFNFNAIARTNSAATPLAMQWAIESVKNLLKTRPLEQQFSIAKAQIAMDKPWAFDFLPENVMLPADICFKLLNALQEHTSGPIGYVIRDRAEHLHQDILPSLHRITGEAGDDWQKKYYATNHIAPLIAMIEGRMSIEAAFSR